MTSYAIDARTTPEPLAFPLVAVMTSGASRLEDVTGRLEERYGPVLAQSSVYLFDDFTSYYEKEFGKGLLKQVVVFSGPREQALLPGDKHAACALERELGDEQNGRRLVNADPGFITLSKLVLASTKDHAHRLYLGQGIHGEITLAWKGHSFERLPWSYPDYVALIPFLNEVRAILHEHLRVSGLDPSRFR